MNRRTVRQLLHGVLGASMLLAATRARVEAQSCSASSSRGTSQRSCTVDVTGNNPARFTNPMLLDLSVSSTATALTVDRTAMDNGRTNRVPVTMSVRGNRSWVVTVQGAATWTGTGPLARTNKPVGDLRYGTTTTGAGTALSTTPATVFTGGNSGTVTSTLYWSTLLSWTGDPPGSYAINVTYTLIAP